MTCSIYSYQELLPISFLFVLHDWLKVGWYDGPVWVEERRVAKPLHHFWPIAHQGKPIQNRLEGLDFLSFENSVLGYVQSQANHWYSLISWWPIGCRFCHHKSCQGVQFGLKVSSFENSIDLFGIVSVPGYCTCLKSWTSFPYWLESLECRKHVDRCGAIHPLWPESACCKSGLSTRFASRTNLVFSIW